MPRSTHGSPTDRIAPSGTSELATLGCLAATVVVVVIGAYVAVPAGPTRLTSPPEEPMRVPSPGGWEPPSGVRPGWDWLPPHGATPRLHAVPWWVRIWYRTPIVDRFAHLWMWDHGGFAVVPPGQLDEFEGWLRERRGRPVDARGCPDCGGRRWRTETLGLATVAWRWLSGEGWVRPSVRVCADCGRRGGVVLTYGPGHRGTLVTVPRAALHLLRGPLPPVVYVAVGLVGVALGLVLAGRVRLAWWQPALVAVAVIWLGAQLAGAVTGITRERLLALRDVVDPSVEGVRAREYDELLRRYRAAPFPVYELDGDWDGPRGIGGYAGDRRGLRSITLTYRIDGAGRPALSITTSRPRTEPDEPDAEHPAEVLDTLLRGEIARQLSMAAHPPSAEPDRSHTGESFDLTVDGYPTPAIRFETERGWVAAAATKQVAITISAENIPLQDVAVAVRATTDLTGYLHRYLR